MSTVKVTARSTSVIDQVLRAMYLPLYDEDHKNVLVRVSFRRFAVVTVSLPLVAFAVCVLLSVLKDFAASTSTHCHVFNFLPSVSAAIGSYHPQSSIWQFAIGLHAVPRYFTAAMYFSYLRTVLKGEVHFFALLTSALNVTEVTSLIGLSFWNSTDYYPVHKTCFMTFVGASELYMLFSCLLLQNQRRITPTELERFSLKRKWFCLLVNVTSFAAAGYFFVRHNNYCEPLVYTCFAAAEYIVILTNMGFHMTACYDFVGKEIMIKSTGVTIR